MVENTLNCRKAFPRDLYWIILKPEKAWRFINIFTLTSWTVALLLSKMHKVIKWGKKDIMKIECPIDFMDLDILGFIDHNITVNIIEDGQDHFKKTVEAST